MCVWKWPHFPEVWSPPRLENYKFYGRFCPVHGFFFGDQSLSWLILPIKQVWNFVVRVIQHKILIYVNFITPLRICTDQQGVIDLVIAIDFSFPLNSVLDWICLLSLCTSLSNTFCPLTDKTVGKISSLQERERRTSTSSTMSTTSQVRADIRGIKVDRVIFLKDQAAISCT